MHIPVTDKYKLSLLTEIEQADIRSFLGQDRGMFVCPRPDEEWHQAHGLRACRNYSVEKKGQVFSQMATGSVWVSPTQVECASISTRRIEGKNVIHLGSRFTCGRAKQVSFTLQLIGYIFRNRQRYSYLLFYNFDLPVFFAAMFAKAMGMQVYVDFEDDYTLIDRAKWKNTLLKGLAFRVPDGVICINRSMVRYFPKQKTVVHNGFVRPLVDKLEFGGSRAKPLCFFFGGGLDDVRGADLLPQVSNALRTAFGDIRLLVSGEGPLASWVRSLDIAGLEFVGFLPEREYRKVLQEADAYLVLQRPDHPFSKGSFPSKIEYYSAFRKPIFVLRRKCE